MTADTRKDKRANVQLKVRYKSATVDEFIEQYAVDISRGGIFIKQKAPMPIGTLLKFEFQLKDESRLIHGVGRVVWRREEGGTEAAGMGIKFIKMDPESKVLVERIVEARGAAPAAYEAGGGDAGDVGAPAPSAAPQPRFKQTLQFDAAALKSGEAGGGGGFFPSTSSEADLPPVEDRTQVRHASEFLASALGSAGIDSEASREAELRAEEARKRSAEIERERAQADAAKKASADAAEAARREAEDHAEAEKRAGERATAEKNAAVEKTAAAARAAAQPEKAAPEKAAPVAAAKAAEKAAPAAKKDEPARSSVRPQPLKVPSLPPPPAPREEPRSMMLPIIGTVLVLGAVAVWWFTRTPDGTGEVANTTETPLTEEDAGSTAVAEGAEDSGAAELAAAAEAVDAGPPAAPVVMAQVRIESTPPGAQVLLGNEDRGVTPLALDLPAGAATSLTLRMAGYTALTRDVTPREGTNAPVRVTLASLPYTIAVETTPPGARVSGGGRTILSPGTLTFDRPRGPVTVTASKNNFTNAVRTLTLPEFTETDGAMHASVSLTLPARAAPAGGGTRRPPGGEPPAGGGEPPAGGGDTPPANPPPANPPPANPPPANPPPGDPLPDNPFG